ncbi:MAG TPA: aminotransferase class V-fold PLP-dependent enzyme, partial [Thermomicrobiales bacterium]|nr:aminotransferase class V-fold PLP-dependent enzyme [Thermomicrobiales bacterium]
WDMDQLFARAGDVITAWSGAEAGTLTACAASGVTLSVAACMTGNDLGRVFQLPDTTGMKNEVLLQKGHSVNFGAPLEQMIRLAGATVREVGTVNQTRAPALRAGLNERTAAAMFVISHHTAQYGFVQLQEFIDICHEAGVPVIIDGAAQDHQIERLVASGADLMVFSGQKYLSGPTAGIVCGRRDLVEAVYLQNRGIGRPMKVGKEAVIGMMATLEERIATDLDDWAEEQQAKAAHLASQLHDLRGVRVSLEKDKVGQPVTRVKLEVNAETTGIDAAGVCRELTSGSPSIKPRAHHTDEGWFYLEPTHVTREELDHVAARLHEIVRT